MVFKLPLNSSDSELLEAVEKWIEFLSKEEYKQAYDLIEHDTYYGWTPELIEQVINNYGGLEPTKDDTIYKVTHIEKTSLEASNSRPDREVNYFDEPIIEDGNSEVIAEIWHSLPLNYEWSDLTATFHVVRKKEYMTLRLQEIHVF